MPSVMAHDVRVLATPVVIRASRPAPPPPQFLPLSPAAGGNLQLWLYHPSQGAALATGIFLQRLAPESGGWEFSAARADGSLSLQLAPGAYQFDTVEPANSGLLRRRYQLSVAADGVAAIAGLAANAQGVYAVTLDSSAPPDARLLALASQPASSFRPASACQLLDHATPARSLATDTSAGFPKVRVRLPSFGRIRALIVPVDFDGLRGRDDPAAFFTPLARDVRDFYLKQSYGGLAMDFDVLGSWVHLPFAPDKYGSRDYSGYRNEIIGLTAGQIDYGRYHAVYFLVPKEMPMSSMSIGPAITTPTWLRRGYVMNGATGGADMYFNQAHGVAGAQWKWMAHETGHAFGLIDEDLNHSAHTLGSWSVMANNWSAGAIEHNAWDRYLQGWLPERQLACLSPAALSGKGRSLRLTPLVRQGAGVKAAMLPLSSSKILVLESRRNEGYDKLPPQQEGLLVYTVDTALGTLGGGYRTQRRQGSSDPEFRDAALRAGDSVSVDGVTVSVTAADADGDTVMLRR